MVLDFFWQGHKDLNPEPTVLETVALPIELYPYVNIKVFLTISRQIKSQISKTRKKQNKLRISIILLFYSKPMVFFAKTIGLDIISFTTPNINNLVLFSTNTSKLTHGIIF